MANGESVREVARLTCLQLPRAGAGLNMVPSPALGLHLRAAEFVMALKLRLAVKVFTKAGPCPACQAPSDQLGEHTLCCGNQEERISRHNALHSTASTAALSPSKETRFLLLGSDRMPADVFLPYWSEGQDITVTHPLQGATVAGAAVTPGYAVSEPTRGRQGWLGKNEEGRG